MSSSVTLQAISGTTAHSGNSAAWWGARREQGEIWKQTANFEAKPKVNLVGRR